jgi:hypothetical protein
MPCRRGISTVLGALLFTIVAVLFVALMLRTFTESASTLTEVASVNLQNAVVENLQISLSYTSTKLTASQAGASVTPLYGTKEGGEYLLDALDGRSLNIMSTAPQGGASQTVQQLQLVENGDFSEGDKNWTLQAPWYVDNALQCARVNTSSLQYISASLWQTVKIPSGLQSLTLNFSYYFYVRPTGEGVVKRLSLTVEVLQNGRVVWNASVAWKPSDNGKWLQFSESVPTEQLSSGSAVLNFTLYLDVKQELKSLDVRLDNVSLVAVVPVAVPSPVGAAVAAAKVALENVGASANCTLTMALNATGFVEVCAPAASGAWVMVSKYYVERGYAWFNATFRGNSALVYAYSAQPFKLMMDYLQVAQPSQGVNVVVANLGTAPVTVYAVWLNGSRIRVEQVLAPGDLLSVPFDLGSSGSALEVRVVTSTRAHVARFATKSAAP